MSMVAHHLVHLNSHLEVYIVRHTHRAGKKTRSVLAQTPMSLFAVPMDARICHFHRIVGYLENGCRKIRICESNAAGTHLFTWTTGPQSKLHRISMQSCEMEWRHD